MVAKHILILAALGFVACSRDVNTYSVHTPMKVPHVEIKPRFEVVHPLDEFLDRIAYLESSGGKNTNHKTLKHGIHAGTAAVGTFGLMPDTARFIAGKSKNPHIQVLVGKELPEVAGILSEDQELTREVAREYASRLARKFKGDQILMAYAWRMGPNRDDLDEASNHPYVQAFVAMVQK